MVAVYICPATTHDQSKVYPRSLLKVLQLANDPQLDRL